MKFTILLSGYSRLHSLFPILKNNDLKILIACIITMCAVSTIFMTQPVFPDIAKTFGTDVVHTRLVFSVASICYAGAFLVIGPFIDRLNLPGIAFSGLMLSGGGIFLSSYCSEYTPFIVIAGAGGFFAALVPASMFPYVSHHAPDGRKGFYMGAIVAAATIGILWGRIVMGGLTGVTDWQSAFRFVALGIFILCILSCLLFDSSEKRFDKVSPGVYYKSAFTSLRDTALLLLYVIGFLIFFGFMGMMTFLTYHLSSPPFNYTAEDIGWISFAGLTALVAPFAGQLSKTTGIFNIILPGIITCIVAIQFVGWFYCDIAIVSGLMLLFFGVYSCQPLVFLLVAKRIPVSKTGVASSFYILSCMGGGSVSTFALGPVWNQFGWEGVVLICSLSFCTAFALSLHFFLRYPGARN